MKNAKFGIFQNVHYFYHFSIQTIGETSAVVILKNLNISWFEKGLNGKPFSKQRHSQIFFLTLFGNSIKFFKILFISIIILIATFPEIDLSYTTGIDSPVSWVFNYLFKNNIKLGENIIFPHGPLAFFTYPLQENILFTLLIFSLLKILMTFNIFKILENNNIYTWLIGFLLSFIFSNILGFTLLIIINILLCYLIYFEKKNVFYKFLGILLTAFAFYINSYIAIISGIISISHFVYFLLLKKEHKQFIYNVLILFGLIVSIWILLYWNISGFFRYCTGIFNLAQNNSSAASLYPNNNWFCLILFLIIVFAIPFLQNTQKSIYYGIIILFSTFAAWKHGMAREDISHVYGFFMYVVVSMFVFILIQRKNIYVNLGLITIGLLLFYINMKNCINYYPVKYEIFGVNNFIEFTTKFSSLKDKANKKIYENTKGNLLPEQVRNLIGNQTTDIYPWDYSIISVNHLNWQPRPVIHSYSVYTPWLDLQNAKHFSSENIPEFLIWEIDKCSADINRGNLESIDFRYLLNDEPQTIIQILKNYRLINKNQNFLVYKRRNEQVKNKIFVTDKIHVRLNEWLKVPDLSKDVLRARVYFSKGFLQNLKSFFYKDEKYYIYYKLSDGSVHKYRITPENSSNGIWIAPYIYDPANNVIEPAVNEILFKCSNPDIVPSEVIIEWEQISFEKADTVWQPYPLTFFGKNNKSEDSIIINTISNFDNPIFQYWSNIPENLLTTSKSYSDSKAYILKPNSFSGTFSIKLDELPHNNLSISTDCWINADISTTLISTGSIRRNTGNYDYSNTINLVISIENENHALLWNGVSIDEQLINTEEWNHIFNKIEYDNSPDNYILKIYFWNTGESEIIIDDFRVVIKEITT